MKKNLYKIFALVVAVAMVVALAGCSADKEAQEKIDEIQRILDGIEISVGDYAEAVEVARVAAEEAAAVEAEALAAAALEAEAEEASDEPDAEDVDVEIEEDTTVEVNTESVGEPESPAEADASDSSDSGNDYNGGSDSGKSDDKPAYEPTPKPAATKAPEPTKAPEATAKPTAAEPTPHTHEWTTQTVYHEDGYWDSQKVGTESVQVGTTTVIDSEGWEETIPGYFECKVCGATFSSGDEITVHEAEVCGGSYRKVASTTIWHEGTSHEEPVYEEQAVYEDVWVDTSWEETITVCSICGATK